MTAVSAQLRFADRTYDAEVAGPPDGPLVLLLHGFPQTRRTWREQVPALGAAGFHAVAFDQRGYSAGARPADVSEYGIDYLVDDVLAAATSLGHDRFHLVGHDWGGQVAWTVAARYPGSVRSLSVLRGRIPTRSGEPCRTIRRRPIDAPPPRLSRPGDRRPAAQ